MEIINFFLYPSLPEYADYTDQAVFFSPTFNPL